MRKHNVFPSLRLGRAALMAPICLAWLAGCDDQKSNPVAEDKAGHGQAVTKNMENFMKNQPVSKPAAPKVQTK